MTQDGLNMQLAPMNAAVSPDTRLIGGLSRAVKASLVSTASMQDSANPSMATHGSCPTSHRGSTRHSVNR